MRVLDYTGYTLYPLNGRYLVWAEDTTCAFVNEAMTEAIPLFTDGDAGRFVIEARGFLAFPDGVEPSLYETGDAYERFHVSERLTEADALFS